ncbi:hypothetical protein LUZ61_014027 [Rhynchospora tenuis]|uniref:BTB/POZ domain-containing protein n=1 Tax=Rhynchospora tenuis TaxID=198213 RepID=A0AAD5Z1B9_9POAL|nr:hypothetical protein LUZ61_014027 [Rhynchospora tenuis]
MSLSSVASMSTAETTSTLRAVKVTGSHLFKIMGYSLQKDIAKGKFLESASFNVGGYDWLIKFYPNGQRMTKNDETSIFVFLKSEEEYVKAQPSFIILNQRGNPLSERHTTSVFTFSDDNEGFGFLSFVKKTAFESVIQDDCLVIRCTVTVFKTFPVEVEPAFPFHVPPPDLQQFSHLLEDGYGVDVTFDVNGQTFSAHKCILAAKSEVFRAQFFGPLKEKSDTIIKIEDMEVPVFKSLLHFIYSETIPEFQEINGSEKKHNMAQHLLVAADRYNLERLKLICQSILYGSIDRSNVVTLLSLAEMYNCNHLKRACLEFLASPEILDEVLASRKLKVNP